MKTCKTCKWWRDKECELVGQTEQPTYNFYGRASNEDVETSPTLFEIEWGVSDDSGLNLRLRTGPEFGCVLHELSTVREGDEDD